jgi:hypothetical protein
MSKAAEYRAKAVEHARLAVTSQSEEVCEIHVRIAASFVALANKEAMRDLEASAYPDKLYSFNFSESPPHVTRP